jgi:hypothetical protein
VIPPPGLVDLNRDNLVVICGPRLSPIIAQVLASDLSRFSTIISCRFDRDSRQVTSSERVTPLYRADSRA